jgi:membrane protease YdiL (CAAX protease family)
LDSQRSRALQRIFVFIGLYIGANIIAAILLLIYGLASGIEIQVLVESLADGQMGDVNFLRFMLIMQAVLIFILPAWFFGKIFYAKSIQDYFDLRFAPVPVVLVLSIFFLVAAYPLVNLSFLANEAIPVSEWMRDMEENAASIINALISTDNFFLYLLNIFLIAVLPAIGEELVFRGILQKQLGKLIRNPVIAIWITAVVFSAIHMQFEGLLPRIALGAVLGYLYYWTKNLWVPIFIHFVNNGFQVSVFYFTGTDLSEVSAQDAIEPTWWLILLSIGAMFILSEGIRNSKKLYA